MDKFSKKLDSINCMVSGIKGDFKDMSTANQGTKIKL